MLSIPKDKRIIIFDGLCNLCDASVQKIIKHDSKDVFRFVASQSTLGQEIINYLGIDTTKTDSIILYQPGVAYYYKAEAAFEIAKDLGGIFIFGALISWLPNTILNSVYDYVARNRYKWYGKKEACMVPTKEILNKFLA